MSTVTLIALMAVATYATRISGFALRGRSLPDAVERFLAAVPIAAFAALLVTGMTSGGNGIDARIVAAALAGIVALRWKRLWLTLFSGMMIYWIAAFLL
jgi:branched-subunit amino acid transport protein